MNRLILLTTLGLFVLSWSLNLVFAEKTTIAWGDISLQSREVRVLLENSGSAAWQGGTLAVKVFQGDRQIEHGSVALSGVVEPGQSKRVSVLLKTPLQQGAYYRVETFLKQGRAPVVSQVWKDTAVFDMPTAGARTQRLSKKQQLGRIGYIAEPHQLRKTIQVIDMKKAMAIF